MVPSDVQDVIQRGWLPALDSAELIELQQLLLLNDERLLQGETACQVEGRWHVCPLTAPGLAASPDLRITLDLIDYFFEIMLDIDELMGRPMAAAPLLLWIDTTPRAEMIAGLLAEIDRFGREQDVPCLAGEVTG